MPSVRKLNFIFELLLVNIIQLSSLRTTNSSTVEVNVKDNTVRCHCNLPSCITTSYMCKSDGKGCYKEINSSDVHSQYRYGCIDSNILEICGTGNSPASERNVSNSDIIYDCCYDDMCNVDNDWITNVETRFGEITDEGIIQEGTFIPNQKFMYSNIELWFRAATIAVPICGIIILFLLITIAARILKSDMIEEKNIKAKIARKQYGFTVMDLYASNVLRNQNERLCTSLRNMEKPDCLMEECENILHNDNETLRNIYYSRNSSINRAIGKNAENARLNANQYTMVNLNLNEGIGIGIGIKMDDDTCATLGFLQKQTNTAQSNDTNTLPATNIDLEFPPKTMSDKLLYKQPIYWKNDNNNQNPS